MFFIWKGKGILIIFYLFVSFIIITLLFGSIAKLLNIDNLPQDFSLMVIFGLTFISGGFITSKTAIDYITVNGKKQIYNDKHSLFFIKMQYWKYILYISGIIFIVFGIVNYFV